MGNRFARRIKSGDIPSIEALKSEFKALAKLTHPDLRRGDETSPAQAEFVAARAEYETALRDFEKIRFGARELRGREEAHGRYERNGGSEGLPEEGGLGEASWVGLALLMKRGFPKSPRHEKERLRYEYAFWSLEEALGPARAAGLRAFESELLDLKAVEPGAEGPILRLLRDLIEYRFAGLPAMRTNVVLSLGRLDFGKKRDTAIRGFVTLLAKDLGIGGELGAGAAGRAEGP